MQFVKLRRWLGVVMKMEDIAFACAKLADDKKAEDIVVMRVGDLTSVAEYFVLCSGTSAPHLRAIRDEISHEMRERYGLRAKGTDGTLDSQWMVLDFGMVLVHVLHPDRRNFYTIEDLWSDAEILDWKASADAVA